MTGVILVLEGADASGKTTLARHLVKHHDARYLHTVYRRDLWRWHLGAYRLAERWAAQGHLVVVDRHWPSECAYGECYRDRSSYPISARCLDRLWLRSAAVYVICQPSDSRVQIANHAKGVPGKVEMVKDVSAAVQYYMDLVKGNLARAGDSYLAQWVRFQDFMLREDVVLHDYLTTSVEATTLRAIRLARRRRRAQLDLALDPRHPNLGGYVPGARWCLVGEVMTTRSCYPFVDRCSFLSSATWLNRGLHDLGIKEPDLVVVNAWGQRELEAVVEARPDLCYAALGRVAERSLIKYGITRPVLVSTPQWARRFDHSTPYARYLDPVFKIDRRRMI